jgi:hypothetical protein
MKKYGAYKETELTEQIRRDATAKALGKINATRLTQ